MADIADIRAGIAANLRTLSTDLRTLTVSDYLLDSVIAPALEVDLDPEGGNYDLTFGRGTDEMWLVVRGFVSGVTDKGAQQRRDRWLAASGDESVKAAVESDKTLGGAVDDLRVESWKPITLTSERSAERFTAAEWRVYVLLSP